MSDLAQHMEAVARELLGEPNASLSKPRELRYGSRGSLSIDTKHGVWHDHENGQGGGVIALITRETGLQNGAALEWLKSRRFSIEPAGGRQIVATYAYRDELGQLLSQVVRFDPKDFRQRRPDPTCTDGWSWSVKDVRRVLYRLPELLEASEGAIVLVVEGEKDADRLARSGLNATTSIGGAGKWLDEYADQIRDVRVVAIPDNDEPGEKHAAAVVASFKARGIPAAILRLDGLPPKGDVCDWLGMGGSPKRLLELAEMALEAPEAEPANTGPILAFSSAADLAGQPIPERKWLVADMVPDRTVTMLGGDGGTGKSLLAMQFAVAVATGTPWLGYKIERPGPALFLSAEDDQNELHRRLASILAAEGLEFGDIDDLFLRSVAGGDSLLAMANRGTGVLDQTPLFAALDRAVADLRPSLLVLDTLADLHSGEENNRAVARQFVAMLRSICITHGCAVLLLAHPSLTGMSSGSGLSGSTAWNASVRSRLYLERVRNEDDEPDLDARLLSVKKANYARSGGKQRLTWRSGVFVADDRPTGLDALAANAKGERVFLKLLDEMTAQGRYVSPNPGPTYAPVQFASHPDADGCTKRVFKVAMESLLTRRVIVVAKHGSGAKARSHIARKVGDDGDD